VKKSTPCVQLPGFSTLQQGCLVVSCCCRCEALSRKQHF